MRLLIIILFNKDRKAIKNHNYVFTARGLRAYYTLPPAPRPCNIATRMRGARQVLIYYTRLVAVRAWAPFYILFVVDKLVKRIFH